MATTLTNAIAVRQATLSTQQDRNKINIWAGGALILGLGVVLIHTGFDAAVATALLWAGACLALGGLLGFLFGIPRRQAPIIINQQQSGVTAVDSSVGKTNTSDQPKDPAATSTAMVPADAASAAPAATNGVKPDASTPTSDKSAQTSPVESNLEQVSDWVTKLLLGAGLTQVEKVPGIFTSWGHSVAQGLGDSAHLASNEIFATAMIVYFLILGFIAGYLITKVELGQSLREPAS